MNVLQDVGKWFTGEGYDPHGECYLWSPGLIALHAVSDALIAIAYYSIPLLLVYFIRRRRDIPFTGIFAMFGLFIVACGTTHVLAIYEIWHGAYWLSGIVKAVTAAASVATAIMLVPIVPQALRLRSPAELDKANRALETALAEQRELLSMYERQRRVATVLQEASLPQQLPALPGIAFDAVYRPAATDSEIGGDWYDAFARRDGRVFISIGDISGHGLEAAATMARVRQTLRAFAFGDDDPARILKAADDALRLEQPGSMATAVAAIFDPATSLLHYALAGHPPPVLRTPAGGAVLFAGQQGLPLGLRTSHEPPAATLELPPGSVVAFYTDGLVENERDLLAGTQALLDALESPLFASAPDRPASALLDAVLGSVQARDDVAILTLAISAPANERFDLELEALPGNSRVARQSLVRALRAWGYDDDFVFKVEVATGEAIMNAIEHAYNVEPQTFSLAVERRDDGVEVTVRDRGAWREQRHDGRGRGFAVMRALSGDVELVHAPGAGGTEVRLRFYHPVASEAHA